MLFTEVYFYTVGELDTFIKVITNKVFKHFMNTHNTKPRFTFGTYSIIIKFFTVPKYYTF